MACGIVSLLCGQVCQHCYKTTNYAYPLLSWRNLGTANEQKLINIGIWAAHLLVRVLVVDNANACCVVNHLSSAQVKHVGRSALKPGCAYDDVLRCGLRAQAFKPKNVPITKRQATHEKVYESRIKLNVPFTV